MKKKLIFSLLFALLFLSSLSVWADEGTFSTGYPDPGIKVSDEMVELLSQNLDNMFPITVMRYYFNEPEQALYSDDGPETIIEKSSDVGKRNIRIFANADGIHDRLAFDYIDEAYQTDFQLSMDVTINDAWPLQQSGCFIGFTNYGVSAFRGASMIALLTDARNTGIYYKFRNEDAGVLYPLETRGATPLKLSIIHLTGHTYVYVEGKYAGQLHDGLRGPFHLMYGAALLKEGDSAGCSFDNLVIRKLGNR